MGKRRTIIPFYGKLSQRLDMASARAAKEGDHKTATKLHEESLKIQKQRRKAAGG